MKTDLTSAIIRVWIFRLSQIIGILILFCIILRNRSNERQKKLSTTGKYLNLWSRFLLYGVPICLIFNITTSLPVICLFTTYGIAIYYQYPKILLTFYQIARLQYCFSQSQIHSKYGYNISVYILLYFIGFLLILWNIINSILNIHPYQMINNTGCKFNAEPLYFYMAILQSVVYTIWDLTVLGLYIFKVRQASNKLKNNKVYKSTYNFVLSRINVILTKVLFLTIIYELVVNINYIFYLYVWNSFQIIILIRIILWMIDAVLSSYIMYLMLPHNDHHYNKLLDYLNKCGIIQYCCCCFSNLRSNINDVEMDQNNKDIDIEMEMTNTESLNQLPQTITVECNQSPRTCTFPE